MGLMRIIIEKCRWNSMYINCEISIVNGISVPNENLSLK